MTPRRHQPDPATTPRRLLAGWGRDDGFASPSTLVMLVPIVFIAIWFTVFTGRMVTVQQEIRSAAVDGARAASITATPSGAETAARATVEQSLRGLGVSCANLNITVSTAAFAAGGTVTVRVECEVNLDDVTSIWAPGTRVFTHDATAVIDTYRGGDQ